ncbi:AfsR/SARP family transcriptional regulator [Streptomyces aidingensis]|nr:BTAD domain-containing putative transcriptional regulator [Streptomyces aidingensis]
MDHSAGTVPDNDGADTQSRAADLWFSLLGPLTVIRRGAPLALGPLKQQLFLAALLTRPNAPVSVDTLTEVVWDGEPPRTARKNLQVYASALRKVLGGPDRPDRPDGGNGRLRHGPGGYVLRLAATECDALLFEELARAGRAESARGTAGRAARLLEQALGLWRGEPFAGLAPRAAALRDAADRLRARRLAVYESWAEARLEAGEPAAVAETAGEMVTRHPLRERLRVIQLTALHRCGRRSEALAAYDDCRRLLARELGLAPGAALERAYRALLDDTPPDPAPAPAPGARPSRDGRAGPCRLPPALDDFTGRAGPLAGLRSALQRTGGGPVVLAGPAGVGKTTLAVHAAHHLAERFPDGRAAARLRTEDGSARPWTSVLGELSRALGCTEPLSGDREEAAAAWRAWLADRRVLLVLDSAPDEAAVRPLLPDAGASAALVTARGRLPGLEPARRIELAPFGRDEALELLGRITGPARLAADPGSAARIVTATGGLPLAVRVAGNRLAVLRHLPLSRYAERLEHPGEALDELAAGGLSVRARLADAWGGLPAGEQAVLRGLGALGGPVFTLADASRVLGLGEREAARALDALIESCVLAPPETGPGPDAAEAEVTAHGTAGLERYELPRLTLLFAREQAGPG